MAQTLMDIHGLKRRDIRYWVLHSAGRRVLEKAALLLDLAEPDIAPAREVLRRFGNMSSATILFVLEETLRDAQPVPGDWGLMIGLGPGFAAEGALLHW
jgi:alkylresorcinol/alkylpyrone synthase